MSSCSRQLLIMLSDSFDLIQAKARSVFSSVLVTPYKGILLPIFHKLHYNPFSNIDSTLSQIQGYFQGCACPVALGVFVLFIILGPILVSITVSLNISSALKINGFQSFYIAIGLAISFLISTIVWSHARKFLNFCLPETMFWIFRFQLVKYYIIFAPLSQVCINLALVANSQLCSLELLSGALHNSFYEKTVKQVYDAGKKANMLGDIITLPFQLVGYAVDFFEDGVDYLFDSGTANIGDSIKNTFGFKARLVSGAFKNLDFAAVDELKGAYQDTVYGAKQLMKAFESVWAVYSLICFFRLFVTKRNIYGQLCKKDEPISLKNSWLRLVFNPFVSNLIIYILIQAGNLILILHMKTIRNAVINNKLKFNSLIKGKIEFGEGLGSQIAGEIYPGTEIKQSIDLDLDLSPCFAVSMFPSLWPLCFILLISIMGWITYCFQRSFNAHQREIFKVVETIETSLKNRLIYAKKTGN